MYQKIKKYIFITCLIAAIFIPAYLAWAADLNTGLANAQAIGLPGTDPRIIVLNIIRLVLGFLGLIAVIIIMYAGWLWMTAGGKADRIDKAKKTIIAAVIGILIIISSFAIVSYILAKITEITGGSGDGSICTPTCGTSEYCCNSACQATPCLPPPSPNKFTLVDSVKGKHALPLNGTGFMRFSAPVKTGQGDLKAQTAKTPGDVTGAALAGFQTSLNSNYVNFQNSLDLTCAKVKSDFPQANIVVPAGHENDICFSPDLSADPNSYGDNGYRVEAAGYQSAAGLDLICPAGGCATDFSAAPDLDVTPPVITFDYSTMCVNTNNNLKALVKDDWGVKAVGFYVDGALAAPTSTPGGLPKTYQATAQTGAITAAGDHEIKILAVDVADNLSVVTKTIIAWPDHCCDNAKNGDETGVDCGGSCAACEGQACAADRNIPATCGGNDLCSTNFCTTVNSDASSCQKARYGADTTSCCICQARPLITAISPVGGFCDTDNNKPCLIDNDCGIGSCDKITANAAPGNLVTISGKNFGAATGTVYFYQDRDNKTPIPAQLAINANSQCDKPWQNNQIVLIMPASVGSNMIKVETANGFSDTNQDDTLPQLNFVVNTIKRPGLCKLANSQCAVNDIACQTHGLLGETINYYGVNFSGNTQFNFGSYEQNVPGGNKKISDDKQGSAEIPNLQSGYAPSFASSSNIFSNYLAFYKDDEPNTGPYISSFDPKSGRPGQYVTISGSGFGNSRGVGTDASKVLFVDGQGTETEANYDFPDICKNSVWSDKQVIVKVPNLGNGKYIIRMEIGADKPDTSNLSPSQFTVDSTAPPTPNLCMVSPLTGSVGSTVDFYGENFGDKGTAAITFQPSISQSGGSIGFWGTFNTADKASTTVPTGAISGEVKLTQGNQKSNPLNFKVGKCKTAAECGVNSAVCCPNGSLTPGQCQNFVYDKNNNLIGSSDQDLCYSKIKNSVYEWEFSTGSQNCQPEDMCGGVCCGGGTCLNKGSSNQEQCVCAYGKPNKCSNGCCGLACDKDGKCPLTDSCAGYSYGQCDNTQTCPNSPGQCSGNQGGSIATGASCLDDACKTLAGCQDKDGNNLCAYINDKTKATDNKCQVTAGSCDLTRDKSKSGVADINKAPVDLKCGLIDNQKVWYYDSVQSCVKDYAKSANGKECLGAACNACAQDFSCVNQGGAGVCASDKNICPSGSSCDNGLCKKQVQPSCECCCDRTQNTDKGSNPGCCAGLTCGDSCGGGGSFGVCSGCAKIGATQLEHNAACNCSGTSGKFCDVNAANGQGACRDCAQLSTSELCSNQGVGTCCVDAMKGNACASGTSDPKVLTSNRSQAGRWAVTYSQGGDAGQLNLSSSNLAISTSDNLKFSFYAKNCPNLKYSLWDNGGSGKACAQDSNGACDQSLTADDQAWQQYSAFYKNNNTTNNPSTAGGGRQVAQPPITTDKTMNLNLDFSQATNQNCLVDNLVLATSTDNLLTNGSFEDDFSSGGWQAGTSIKRADRNNPYNYSYCAYYQCGSDKKTCDSNAIASSTAKVFATQNECKDKCSQDSFINNNFFGLTCGGKATSTPQCDTSKCTGFACLNQDGSGPKPRSCGICCCDPAKQEAGKTLPDGSANPNYDACKDLNRTNSQDSLSCKPNQTPCGGDKRGLCCGCSLDSSCGNSETAGCSADSCCRARPVVEDPTAPAKDAKGVCRNAMISATFNQLMDTKSFINNVIVFRDYGLDQCPNGTKYLTLNGYKGDNLWDRLMKTFIWLAAKIPYVDQIFFSGHAYAETNNFCAIAGTVNGVNSGGKTTLAFSPNNLLDGGQTYYVIIKGDSNLNDGVKDGILSSFGVSMSGPDSDSFNAVNYSGKIWSFATLAEQAKNQGICEVSRVAVAPDSYIFQTAKNDLKENDTNPQDPTFDTVDDDDKVYTASALSADGQSLAPVPDYSWTWRWMIDNNNIVSIDNKAFNSAGDRQLIRASEKVTDGETYVNATAQISSKIMSDANITGKAHVYVFTCQNPWPAVDPITHSWGPWGDKLNNCTVCNGGTGSCAGKAEGDSCAGGNGQGTCGKCYNNNFKLYYCRDANGAGTTDDLPAILQDAVIRGFSNDLNIMKEYYFLREGKPAKVSGLTVRSVQIVGNYVSYPNGGTLYANWAKVTGAAGAGVTGYKLYYGEASKQYTKMIDIGNDNVKYIEGLTNNKTYYFAVTSYNASKTESDYSDEVSAIPTDKVGPDFISPFSITTTVSDKTLSLNWPPNHDDTVSYGLYYGASNNYANSVIIRQDQCVINCTATLNNLTNGVRYYLGLAAIDSAGNHSTTTLENIPIAAPTNFQAAAGDSQVRLSWDPVDGAQYYVIEQYNETDIDLKNPSYVDSSISNTTEIMKGLVNGSVYKFRVKAYNRIQNGPASVLVNATPAK